jgi:hypothetical protein
MGGILGSALKQLSPVYDAVSSGSIKPLVNFGLQTLGPIGQILSAVSSAQGMFSGKDKEQRQAPVAAAQEPPFNPQRPDQMQQPESLGGEFSAFSPEQQRSALATKGLNTGLGSDEDSYYRNLIQRSLIGDGNQVQQDNPNFLLPVESQYFSRQGKDTSNIMNFLKGISG